MTSGQGGGNGWIGLAEVWQWIDTRYGIWKRLSAGWVDPDDILAEALGTGSIRACGFGPSHARHTIRFESGQPIVAVCSTLDEIRLKVTTPASGSMIAYRRDINFTEVEINEIDLGSYCTNILGSPLMGDAANQENVVEPDCKRTGRHAPRPSPKRQRADAMVKALFPEGVPENRPPGEVVLEVLIKLQEEEKNNSDLIKVSTATIRRALGYRR
jgi:hypothetical protein